MTHLSIKPLPVIFAAISAGIYEYLLTFDGLFSLLIRWTIGILTVVYLYYQIKHRKNSKL
jgi:hypothetical protein